MPAGSIITLKQSDDCEVLTEGKNDDDPSGWWPATVKMMKGEFYVVDYKIQDETKYSDIIPSDRIRIPNKKYTVIIARDFFIFSNSKFFIFQQ